MRYLLLHSLKICQLFPQFCWTRKPKQRGDKEICFNQCSCSWLNICIREPFTDICGEQASFEKPFENGGFSVCILSYQHHTTVTCFCVLKCLVFRTVTRLFFGCHMFSDWHDLNSYTHKFSFWHKYLLTSLLLVLCILCKIVFS